MVSKEMNYQDIYVVEDFDEAAQFRYEHNDETVEIGTPVAWEFEPTDSDTSVLRCFAGIYYTTD